MTQAHGASSSFQTTARDVPELDVLLANGDLGVVHKDISEVVSHSMHSSGT